MNWDNAIVQALLDAKRSDFNEKCIALHFAAKLVSMLFIAYSTATAINAGNVHFRKNPMAINYPQWVAFAAYAFKQAKWLFIDKPSARYAYVNETLDRELAEVIELLLGPGKGTEIVFS